MQILRVGIGVEVIVGRVAAGQAHERDIYLGAVSSGRVHLLPDVATAERIAVLQQVVADDVRAAGRVSELITAEGDDCSVRAQLAP